MAPIKDKKVLQALMANLQAGVERGEGDELIKRSIIALFPSSI